MASPSRFSLDQDVNIRIRLEREGYNKCRVDFETLDEYNDYLEEVEDIVFNLVNNIDIVATNLRIQDYKKKNAQQIAEIRARRAAEKVATAPISESQQPKIETQQKVPTTSQPFEKIPIPVFVPQTLLPQARKPKIISGTCIPSHVILGSNVPNPADLEEAKRRARAGGYTFDLQMKRSELEAFSSLF